MYMNKMITVGRAENGFVIECQVPVKKDKRDEVDETMASYSMDNEKQYVAKDADEATTLVEKLLPLLDDTFTSEDEFNAAFDKAAK